MVFPHPGKVKGNQFYKNSSNSDCTYTLNTVNMISSDWNPFDSFRGGADLQDGTINTVKMT